MTTELYNYKGEIIGKTHLPKEIFDVELNHRLLHQVVVSQMARQRQISAHTKDRGEVRGGGRKPWRQKGTGRARHGSIRSPLWKGGGVTHGPRVERIFAKVIPKKMRRKALFMALSQKVRDKELFVLDRLDFLKPKTKEAANIIRCFFKKPGSVLIVLPNQDKNIILSFRNIDRAAIIEARELRALDVLNFKYLILLKDSITSLKDTFLSHSKEK